MTAKQLTRIGVFYIEEAILETLFQANGEYVRATDISLTLGVKFWDNWDWIVNRLLHKLEKEDRVKARLSKGGKRKTGWKLTTHESNRRADIYEGT